MASCLLPTISASNTQTHMHVCAHVCTQARTPCFCSYRAGISSTFWILISSHARIFLLPWAENQSTPSPLFSSPPLTLQLSWILCLHLSLCVCVCVLVHTHLCVCHSEADRRRSFVGSTITILWWLWVIECQKETLCMWLNQSTCTVFAMLLFVLLFTYACVHVFY